MAKQKTYETYSFSFTLNFVDEMKARIYITVNYVLNNSKECFPLFQHNQKKIREYLGPAPIAYS